MCHRNVHRGESGITVKTGKGRGLKGGRRARESVCIFVRQVVSFTSFPFSPSFPLTSSIPFMASFSSIPFISFIAFLPSKSLTQVCHFFRNFIDFLPVENFFELSTSYQQLTFFDVVFGKNFGESAHFRHFCSTSLKLYNSLINKEIKQKIGQNQLRYSGFLAKFWGRRGRKVINNLSLFGGKLKESRVNMGEIAWQYGRNWVTKTGEIG